MISKLLGVKIGDCFYTGGRIYAVQEFSTFGLGFICCICVDCENNRNPFNIEYIKNAGIIDI